MAVGGIGRMTARAAGSAAGALGELMGSGVYPETEYGLAAYLFDHVVQAEKDQAERDRTYYLDLMSQCLEAIREGR